MPSAIETLVPHRAPMLFVEALTDCTDTTARATAQFPCDHFAVANGAVLETALIECVAQTVAAALGQRARNHGHSGNAAGGMLLAVTQFKIQSRAPAETQLDIEVRELKRLGPMLMIFGRISCGGQVVASGELTLYA